MKYLTNLKTTREVTLGLVAGWIRSHTWVSQCVSAVKMSLFSLDPMWGFLLDEVKALRNGWVDRCSNKNGPFFGLPAQPEAGRDLKRRFGIDGDNRAPL